MSSIIGQSLGRYHILEQLGEGGMATVYKAYDTSLERDVAIKVIRAQRELSDTFLLRFDREAKALAKLSHSNIVKVLDYGEEGGLPYIVMEYMPGGTLKHRLGQPIPYREAARMLVPIARALEYAHQKNIIHRDVKPSNILITDSGEMMLSDFGIAKILEGEETTLDLTGTGVGIGTPEYMAPEQGLGQNVDGRTDIYALGIVLYEMVTGRKPYQADTPLAVLLKKSTEPLPRPGQYVPNLPEVVEQVLIKALARDPNNRYQNMGEFIQALERIQYGIQIAEAPAVSETKGSRSKVIWLAIGGVAILGVCILIGVGIISFLPQWLSKPASQETSAPIIVTATDVPSVRPSDTPWPTALPSHTPTEIIPFPIMNNFLACLGECAANGSNARWSFPEKTTKIYLQWQYRDVPIGAHYIRTWSMDGNEWVRYDCTWPGPELGVYYVTLTDPDGLTSGVWELNVFVNEQLVLQQQITVEGNWDIWTPAGIFYSCEGKR